LQKLHKKRQIVAIGGLLLFMSNVKFFIIIIAINPSEASSLVQVRAVITGKQPVATGHLSQRPEVNALTRFVRQIF